MPVTQYIGARYMPIFADPIEHSTAKTYEPLTIVLHEGNSYTSKQFVPVGIEITNEAYWAETGNYNAQVEAYRQETLRAIELAENAESISESAQADINTLLPKSEFSDTNTVKKYIDTEVSKVRHPRLLAHRGLSTISSWIYSIDNSLWSFMGAFADGFDGFECDVRKDVNGVMVMIHDSNVKSVSNTDGEIAQLDYTSVKYATRRTKEDTRSSLTTLDEMAELVHAFNGFCFVESKESGVTAAELTNRLLAHNLSYDNFAIFKVNDRNWFEAALDIPNVKVGYHTTDYTATDTEMRELKAICDAHAKPYAEVIVRTVQPQHLQNVKRYGFLSCLEGNLDADMSFNANYIDYSIADRKWNGEDDATSNYKGRSIRGLTTELSRYETLQDYLNTGISSSTNHFFGRATIATLTKWFDALGYTSITPQVNNGGTIMGVCTSDFVTGFISIFKSDYIYSFTYEKRSNDLQISLISNRLSITAQTIDIMYNAAKNDHRYFDGFGYATSSDATSILGISNTYGCNVTINHTSVMQSLTFVPVNQNLKTIYIYKRNIADGAHTVYTITGA